MTNGRGRTHLRRADPTHRTGATSSSEPLRDQRPLRGVRHNLHLVTTRQGEIVYGEIKAGFAGAFAGPCRRQEVGAMEETKRVGCTRRALLTVAVAGAAGFAGPTLVSPLNANVSDDAVELIKQLTGKIPTESDRLHLAMPRAFPTSS